MHSAGGSAVLALSGGVGGAKLALGLQDVVTDDPLHLMANTGDDFSHLGLHISPDIDTLLYTLSGRANVSQGWGLEEESWRVMAALEGLGGETWFRLGDKDLATHLFRAQQLARGASLAVVTAQMAQRMGITCHVHPMSNATVRTVVHCDGDTLPFQRYFVEQQCHPRVSGFSFEGINEAPANGAVLDLLASATLSSIIICPSNPFVSIDPILQLPGFWVALRDSVAPVAVVSPIVAGAAIKGPTAKMMRELHMPVTALGVAQHYCRRYPGLLDYFVIDESDAKLADAIGELGVNVAMTSTIMKNRQDKRRLAQFVLKLLEVAGF
ncbi:MAG: 2-phospho-L-lactate transferase [Halioglobus sp.]|nr:2-phospho-L-lactate transferase [Halioglobus sp.]